MKHSKDNPKQDGSPSRRRFFQILDRLAGIEGWEKVSDDQFVREAWEADPVTVTPEEVEEVVAQWRSLQEAAAAPRPRQAWWRRPAAVIPMVTLVLLGAATPVYLVWSGRHSTRELAYEDALRVVFDQRFPLQSRHVAQGRVLSSMLRGITALKLCTEEAGELGSTAARAVRVLKASIAKPDFVGPGRTFPAGDYEKLLSVVSNTRLPSRERVEAAEAVLDEIQAGISVLQASRRLGGQFNRNADTFFGHLARWVSR